MEEAAHEPFHVEAWDEGYRRYQATLASRYLLPTLRKWTIDPRGKHVLEVGSGDGGCGAALCAEGARVTALELDARLVRIARALNAREGLDIETFAGDVCDAANPAFRRAPFDLVLLRDVVEHLENLEQAFAVLRRHLAPGGALFVDFPPYWSPFGAHQQILPRRRIGFVPYNKLPWIQLLPRAAFLAIAAGDTAAHREVARLRDIRLTLARFERAVQRSGLRVRQREGFVSRPSFKLRYGLPVIRVPGLERVPLLRELVVTGVHYLLVPDGAAGAAAPAMGRSE